MSRQVVAWLLVLFGAVVVVGGLGYYKYAEIQTAIAAAAAFPEPQETVEAVRVRPGEWAPTARAVGTVVALRQVEIRNELAGTVVEVGFASGDVVEAGDVLIRLDARQEEAGLAAAEAETELARLTFERRKKLRASQTVSAQELDEARQQYEAAAARVRTLKVGIEKKTILAPFRARVGLTDMQPGAYLDVGTLIAMLQGVDDDAFVDFSLPQDAAMALRAGASVMLAAAQIPEGGVPAEIMAENASVDDANRTVRFRALAKGLGGVLRPGAFVDVTATVAAPTPMLFVPVTSVRRAPYGQLVYALVEEEGKLRARQRMIKTGPVQGDSIAVLEGLAEGDLIAAAGSFKLREGLLVQVGGDSAADDGTGAGGGAAPQDAVAD
jgi:membrane fusion protein (multidrug efflux system)